MDIFQTQSYFAEEDDWEALNVANEQGQRFSTGFFFESLAITWAFPREQKSLITILRFMLFQM